MPRYFFDSRDDVHISDREGIELLDLQAARNEAARTLAERALELLPASTGVLKLVLEVRDDAENIVLRANLTFSTDPEV